MLALDASHVVYLGRAAIELSAGDTLAASSMVAELLRTASCWQVGRLWTTELIRDEQIDPQLGFLGLAPPADSGWGQYLMTFSPSAASPLGTAIGGGHHDADLLSRAIEHGSECPTLLITNDESLQSQAMEWTIDASGFGLTALNSTTLMLRLLACGAISEGIVEACLVAEHRNIEEMKRRGMSDEKYDRKIRRLEAAGHQLLLHRFDQPVEPDETRDEHGS